MSTSTKKSLVWTYFTDCPSNKNAKCDLCGVAITRGGEGRKAGTSSLKKHLRFKHKAEYDKLFGMPNADDDSVQSSSTQQPSTSAIPPLKQPSIEQMIDRKKLWDINDSRAKRYHYLIGEMIAVDNEPFTLVESHLGFQRLLNNALPQYQFPSRKYFSENIIPDIYERVVRKLKSSLLLTENIALTTDLWTCSKNKLAFMSCTAHWLLDDFTLNHAVLNMTFFPESHTSENISNGLLDAMSKWDIPITKIRAVVHDNASNVVKGVRDSNLPSARCFIHTLQLTIDDAIKAHPSITETLSAARRIVTHFSHSGYTKLHEIQAELKLPQNKLHQDVPTRWNSTFYLLERMLEQRRAISVYFSESRTLNFDNLSSEQWEILQQLIKLLKPFEEVTKITSSTYSPISDVIPHAATLLRYLQKPELILQTDQIDDLRNTLKENMSARFDVETLYAQEIYFLSTLLDPRYKTLFYNSFQIEQARQEILRQALRTFLDDADDTDDDETAPKKSRHTADLTETHDLFWSCFDEEVENKESSKDQAPSNAPKNSAAAELEHYINSARSRRDTNPFKWWAENKGHYPILHSLAAHYLSSPSSSVYSERLFSEAGNIYETKRSRLDPHRAEKLAFLHHNLPLINFDY